MFRPYSQDPMFLLPPSLSDFLDKSHPAPGTPASLQTVNDPGMQSYKHDSQGLVEDLGFLPVLHNRWSSRMRRATSLAIAALPL